METNSLKNLDKDNTKDTTKEVIVEVLKSDKDRFYFSPEQDPKHGLSVTIVWGKSKVDTQNQEQDSQNQQNQKSRERGEPSSTDSRERGDPDSTPGSSDREGQEQENQEGGQKEKGGREGKGGNQNQGQNREGETSDQQGGTSSGRSGSGSSGGSQGQKDQGQEDGGGEKEGEEGDRRGKGEEKGRKGRGGDREGKPGEPGSREPGSGGDQGQSGSEKDPGEMDIDDILGGSDSPNNRRNRGQGGPGNDEDGENGDYEDDKKKGKDKDKEGGKNKGKKTDKVHGEKQVPRESGEEEDSLESDTSGVEEFPPSGEEEPDPKVLDVFFGKTREVEEKENKLIHRSFVFKSGRETLEVFKIDYKNISDSGDRSYIKKIADFVYYLYEPFLKASATDLDPGEPVIPSPISPRGLRSPSPHERPRISYGAIADVERVDFSSLIVLVDVSGSMDMDVVRRTVNSYFQSIFYGLKRGNTSQVVNVIVILHGTNAGVFGVRASWKRAGNIISKVAESSRDLVGTSNGSESTLTGRIEDIIRTIDPIPNSMKLIRGQVPLIWISDFLWSVTVGSQFTRFLANKPALLVSTMKDPEETGGNKDVFNEMGHNVALTILRKVPYGALVYFPNLAGITTSRFTPGGSSPSWFRVYARGGAYEHLYSRRDKLGRVSIINVR